MDKFNKLKPEQKILIAIVVLGLIAGLYYSAVIMDVDAQLAEVDSTIASKSKEKDKYKDFRGAVEIEELKDRYAKVMRQIEDNKKILPVEDMLAEFIHALETDAEESGVQIISYEPQKKKDKDYYAELPVEMEIRGTFIQIVHFLKLLAEPSKRLTNINSLELTVEDKRRAEAVKALALGPQKDKEDAALVAKFTASAFTYTGTASADKKKGK